MNAAALLGSKIQISSEYCDRHQMQKFNWVTSQFANSVHLKS